MRGMRYEVGGDGVVIGGGVWAGWIMGVLNGVWRCFHGPLATSRLFVLPPPGGGGGRRSEWGCSSGGWVLEAGKARCASCVVCSSWWALNRVRQRAGVPRCFYRQRAADHKPLTTCRRFRFPGRSWPCRLRAGARAVGDAEDMATINWPTTGHKLQATCRRLVIPVGRALAPASQSRPAQSPPLVGVIRRGRR